MTRFGGCGTIGGCAGAAAGWATTAAWDWCLRFGLGGVGCAGGVPLAGPLGAGSAAAVCLWTLARLAGHGGSEWSCVAPGAGWGGAGAALPSRLGEGVPRCLVPAGT